MLCLGIRTGYVSVLDCVTLSWNFHHKAVYCIRDILGVLGFSTRPNVVSCFKSEVFASDFTPISVQRGCFRTSLAMSPVICSKGLLYDSES
jgi:hypothetical protein